MSPIAAPGALQTPRLHLEVPDGRHVPGIFASFASDPEVTRYLRWLPAKSLAESEAAMRGRLERLAAGTELSWIATRGDGREVVGSISLWPHGREVELGFALARACWGMGLAVEASRAVLGWAADSGRFDRVFAACDVDHPRSGRVLEKLGLRYERTVPGFALHPALGDEPRACRLYGAPLRPPGGSEPGEALG